MIRYLRQPAGLINVSTASNITSTVVGTSLTVTNQTPSTSTTTGALIVAGGIGVAGNINANNIYPNNANNNENANSVYILTMNMLIICMLRLLLIHNTSDSHASQTFLASYSNEFLTSSHSGE